MATRKTAWRDFAVAFVINAVLVVTWAGSIPPTWLLTLNYLTMAAAVILLIRALWVSFRPATSVRPAPPTP